MNHFSPYFIHTAWRCTGARYKYIICTLIAVACNPTTLPKIRHYHQVKTMTQPGSATPAAQSNIGAAPSSAHYALTWQTPTAWHETKGNSMRRASFQDSHAQTQTTLVVLAKTSAKYGENIQRWRRQLGLPALPKAAMADYIAAAETVYTHDRLKGRLFILAGKPKKGPNKEAPEKNAEMPGMYASIFFDQAHVIFVKMTGPSGGLQKQGSAYRKLVASLTHKKQSSL